MPELSHNDLLKLGRKFGYPLDKNGLCYGFSCMVMQAILAGEEIQFWQRLKLIEAYKENFSSLVAKINEAKDKQDQLADNEYALLEILAFYAGIELYLRPHKHQDLFNKQDISQTSLDEIYRLVHPTKLGETALSIPLDNNYACNKDGLTNYLYDLEKKISNYSNLPFLVSNLGHNVLLKYNSSNSIKPWMYVDTEDFARYTKNSEYYRELSTLELVDSLFASFGDSKFIVFNMKLVAINTHPINQYEALKQFASTYQMNKQHVSMYDKDGAGLLHIACQNGHLDDVEFLLEQKGIKTNKETKSGAFPLYIACHKGYAQIVMRLLACDDIDINKQTQDGSTSLLIACQNGHVDAVKLLLARKETELNIAMEDGGVPLHIACQYNYVEIVILLLAPKKKIKINKSMDDGSTPLFIACQFGCVDVVALLLAEKNIKINKANESRVTPLHIACDKGHSSIVRLLLQTNKAALYLKNNKGKTALDIAFASKNTAVIEEIFLHVQKNNLSLKALMSSETINKARDWVSTKSPHTNDFFVSSSLPDLKNFIQDKLETLGHVRFNDRGSGC